MSGAEKYDVLVLGSGTGGKWMATTMAQEGMRTAVVERRYIGGACVNIACLSSKNVIHTAKVSSLVRRHQEFGIQTGLTAVNMSGVYARKRKMVDEIVQVSRTSSFQAARPCKTGDYQKCKFKHVKYLAAFRPQFIRARSGRKQNENRD
jgi:pyruvate/2-oxoglutarate dehydrogenase complex dihydrolipoamide dehydrogenase (E3) component